MSVTNPLKQSAVYDGGWSRDELTPEFIDKKLQEMKESFSTLMYYGMGCYITALSRKALMDICLSSHEFDRDLIYSDTDSVKYTGNYDHLFEEYNKKVYQSYLELIKKYPDLTIEMFMPEDVKGVKHPIGYYEDDGLYEEFKTLGAKKYAYRENGELHLTVSGVAKTGVTALKDDINNFDKGFIWDYHTSGKLTHFYHDEQPEADIIDDEGNLYHSTYKYGIILAPTTYTLGLTDLYEKLIDDFIIRMAERRKRENG